MKPATRSSYVEAAQRIIQHVVAHLDEALDLEYLAAEACLSPFHFHRVFRGIVGETPLELVRRLRMERAAWHLAHSARSVTQVAFDAGYETHEAFTRAFRTAYGAPPSAFKRRKHPRIELAATCGVHFTPDGRVTALVPRDSGGAMLDVTIKQMPELRVGTIRHVGPYNQIPVAFERLGAIVSRSALAGYPGAAMLAMYHDDPDATPADQLRSDAAIVVPDDLPMPEGLIEQRVPAGTYASCVHVGPYEQLGDAWARLMGEWLSASGRRLGTGVSYEIYRNTPADTPKAELRTELYMPVSET